MLTCCLRKRRVNRRRRVKRPDDSHASALAISSKTKSKSKGQLKRMTSVILCSTNQ